MARKDAEAFIKKVQNNPDLQKQLYSSEQQGRESILSSIVDTGKSAGFDFTPQEIEQVWSNLNSGSEELNETELNTVSGSGKFTSDPLNTYCNFTADG